MPLFVISVDNDGVEIAKDICSVFEITGIFIQTECVTILSSTFF